MPIAFIGPTKMPLLIEQNVFLQNLSCCNIILIFSSSKAMRMNHYCRSDHRLNSCWLNPDAKVLLGAWQTLSHPKTITFSQSLYLAGKSEIVTILSHQKTMPQSHNLFFLPEKSNLSFFRSSSIVKIKRPRECFAAKNVWNAQLDESKERSPQILGWNILLLKIHGANAVFIARFRAFCDRFIFLV